MDKIPPEFKPFLVFLESQPLRVRDAYDYCLCLLMVESGDMETVPGPAAPISMFKNSAGETFPVEKPPLSQVQIDEVLETLRSHADNDDET
jgi:hypothetical protein